ncbi:hypothetical protein HZ326_31423 [Fusarium oxysporum f. sp. albedinis]|nr:hypothetical protein HZ326_31423 [Fusarium oxysporum f. sp. albedinis]
MMRPLFDVKTIESSGETDVQSRDTTRQLKDTATETRMTTRKTTRNVPTKVHKSSGSSSSSSDGRAMLQNWLDLPGEWHRETRRLQEALKRQMEIMGELLEAVAKQQETMDEMEKQMTEKFQLVHEHLKTIVGIHLLHSSRSYAGVKRSSTCMPQTAPRTATSTVSLIPTDTLYCTIDVLRLQDDDTRRLAGTIRATVENQTRAELDNFT